MDYFYSYRYKWYWNVNLKGLKKTTVEQGYRFSTSSSYSFFSIRTSFSHIYDISLTLRFSTGNRNVHVILATHDSPRMTKVSGKALTMLKTINPKTFIKSWKLVPRGLLKSRSRSSINLSIKPSNLDLIRKRLSGNKFVTKVSLQEYVVHFSIGITLKSRHTVTVEENFLGKFVSRRHKSSLDYGNSVISLYSLFIR